MKKYTSLLIILALLCSSYRTQALNNPYSLYSTALGAVSIEGPLKDPYGQMRKFLGEIWNFLPENTQLQKSMKEAYKEQYQKLYGQPVASLDSLCKPAVEKGLASLSELTNKVTRLTDDLKREKEQSLRLTSELKHEKEQSLSLQGKVSQLAQEVEKGEVALQEHKNKCNHDLNAIQEGFADLINTRDELNRLEKQLAKQISVVLEEKSINCQLDTSKCVHGEYSENLPQSTQELEETLKQAKTVANILHQFLLKTIGIDLPIAIKVEVKDIDYNENAIEWLIREANGVMESTVH